MKIDVILNNFQLTLQCSFPHFPNFSTYVHAPLAHDFSQSVSQSVSQSIDAGCWSSGTILASGAKGPGLNSGNSPT